MEQTVILLFLGWNSWTDIRKKEISLWSVCLLALYGIGKVFYEGTLAWSSLESLAVGGGVLCLSALTRGAVGMGDGVLLIALGCVLPLELLSALFLMGLLGSSVWGMFLLVFLKKSGKTELPFVPFLLLGYVGGMMIL